MSCHDTRERLSDLLDGALDSAERAQVGAHLEGCADCQLELDRLRATVSLLSRVERPRAPVGFVDRVTAAAHGLPQRVPQWYRNLGRRLFLPLDMKLPVHAAAMLLVAVVGVYLLQGTPELRDAARPELQSRSARTEPAVAPKPRTTPARPAPPPAPSLPPLNRKDLGAARVDAETESEPEPRAEREAENTMRADRRLDSPQPTPASQAAPAAQAPPTDSRAKSRDAAEGQSGAVAPAAPAMAPRRQSAVSSAPGRLNVKNRPAAERALAGLLARLGGAQIGRREERSATVVDVLVPEARYADFVSGLTALGAFAPEGQPVALPTEPPQLRLSIRITE